MNALRDHRLRVYIACASAELERAAAVVARLRAHAEIILVVSTWTERLPATRKKYNARSDRDVPREALIADLRRDLAEVANCDLLLKLCGIRSDGAATEWGYGISRDHATAQPILVAAGDVGAFELLADNIFATDDEAIAFVVAEARKGSAEFFRSSEED